MLPEQVRQGDVLIERIASLPKELVPVPCDPARGAVLAHGEATGHAHAINSERARLFRPNEGTGGGIADRRMYLQIIGRDPVLLKHDEHGPIQIAPGWHRITRQREYVQPAVDRKVAD